MKPISTTFFASSEGLAQEERRTERLAELVMALTGCASEAAHYAVDGAAGRAAPPGNDALEVVARAVVSIRRGIDLREGETG